MSGVTSSQIAYDQVHQCFCCYVVSFVGGAAYWNNDDDNEPDDGEPDDNEPEVDIWHCFWKTFFH